MRLAIRLAVTVFAVAAVAEETYDQTWRQPIMSIPLVAQAPTMDGTINVDEWQHASLFPALMSRDPLAGDGVPPAERTWVYMCYDDSAVYWAFRQDLPAYERPVLARATERDTGEGSDNTVNILFSVDPDRYWQQFNFSGNANGAIYDRRFDDGTSSYYNPDLTYRATKHETFWEGEMRIPFAELGLTGAPAAGSSWNCYFYSAWRQSGTRLFAWPYVRWRSKGETGTIVFAGAAPAVRFTGPGEVAVAGPGAAAASVSTQLFFRSRGVGRSNFFPALMSAVDASTGEGATFQSFAEIVRQALSNYQPVEDVGDVGEYLLRYELAAGDTLLARGAQAFKISPPVDLKVTPYFLQAQQLQVAAESTLDEAAAVAFTLRPGDTTTRAAYQAGRAAAMFETSELASGRYTLTAVTTDAAGRTIDVAETAFERPPPPNWWLMPHGRRPVIPPPWTPIVADGSKTSVLLRDYYFTDEALPAAITARGVDILAAPIRLTTSSTWSDKQVQLAARDEESVTYHGELRRDGVRAQVRTRIEFDGFMLVDVELTGSGQLDRLELEVPFHAAAAQLMQTYSPAPGPGPGRTPRFHGAVPADGCVSPPFITQWLGTDRYGLEFSCECTAGWSMAKPSEAVRVTREDDRVVLRIGFISKPVALTETPRRIRFGLVATPTKTVLPHIQRARFYDDVAVALLPYDWAGFPAWHPPLTDPALIAEKRAWVQSVHDRGQKLLVNGGWAVSVQDDANASWVQEMFAEPISNVSYSGAKQYAYCYRSPYAAFLANSFAHNLQTLDFDGIRFDTVTPGYACQSEVHGCGWRDDSGNLWPRVNLFAQRECWKRIYRTFHGGIKWEGIIYTPNAAGPIMAVHSFSDHHEIGEGFYQTAANLKLGYPPDMVRAMMTGDQYGLVTAANLKHGPLYYNERIAALIVNTAEPRFLDCRNWRVGYAAHCSPAPSIWDAWEWVDRYSAEIWGWWRNAELLQIASGDKMVLGTIWLQPGRRCLLVVTNYEQEPLPRLPVKLALTKLGFERRVYAEDAITFQPVPISDSGELQLDIFGQRYRLLRISEEQPRYRDEVLADVAIGDVPAELQQTWHSANAGMTPYTTYVVTAEVKIDGYLGAAGESPNIMGKFSPSVRHFVELALISQDTDLTGINGSHRLSEPPFDATDLYRRAYRPQWWEPTGDWMTMFLPVRTNAAAGQAQVIVSITDAGQARVRNVRLRRLLY